MSRNKKAFVAMSGGVDSSVTALLLKNQDYDVVGVFMRCYNLDGCAEREAEDARRVAEKIGIPFYVWDFEEEYKKRVVDYMVEGYRQGITPNPDVMCNKEIKFGIFFDRARAMGADYVATGHYARLMPEFSSNNYQFPKKSYNQQQLKIENYKLKIAHDVSKDQSYFLWTLTQDKLRHCLFPIGDYLKSEVRAIAREAGLPTAEKKDSQGICFLGKVTLEDFLKLYIPEKQGEVLTTSGKKAGEHDGAYFYTIGQRHGLDLGIKNHELGIRGRMETKPHYVAGKNIVANTIIVAEGADNPALFKKEIDLAGVNFIKPLSVPRHGVPVYARVRYRQPLSRANMEYRGSNIRLVFDKPQKFVAPGQSAVFYSEQGEMLGGGVIS